MSRLCCICFCLLFAGATAARSFSAAFFFGDSLFDTGNNNYLVTPGKADYLPYGCDFPGNEASGRFSNGRLVPDLLVARLGLGTLSPPFLDGSLSVEDLQRGANFASAGSGLDDDTSNLANVLTVGAQVELLGEYMSKLRASAGNQVAASTMGSSIIFISLGSNDFIGYYVNPARSASISMSDYQDYLLSILQNFIQKLHEAGGRSVVVLGLAPLGCLPVLRSVAGYELREDCVEYMNQDAQDFNTKLQGLLARLQTSLGGNTKLIASDTHDFFTQLQHTAAQNGFVETARGCCATGTFETSLFCNPLSPLCTDRSQFFFFDAVHPTEAVYKLATDYIFDHVIPQF